MNSFKAPGQIKIHPGENLPATFNIRSCSTEQKNDEILPYGTNISSIVVNIYHVNKTDVTTEWLYQAASTTDNIIYLRLMYPATSLDGVYDIKFTMTLDDNSIKYAYFDKLFAIT